MKNKPDPAQLGTLYLYSKIKKDALNLVRLSLKLAPLYSMHITSQPNREQVHIVSILSLWICSIILLYCTGIQ
jgi:hypothetical protein